MYKVTTFSDEHKIDITNDYISIDDANVQWDSLAISDHEHSILVNNKVYNVFIEKIDTAQKTVVLNINGSLVESKIQEPIDQVLKNMGIDFTKNQKKDPIKAPMPGLILKISVELGQAIKKGDPVLILEAMKMENVFKSPADAVVKEIHINQGQAVEKGQVLITLA